MRVFCIVAHIGKTLYISRTEADAEGSSLTEWNGVVTNKWATIISMYLNENTQSVIEFKLPKIKKWQEVFPTTFGADGRTWTGTEISPRGILSPLRLPISPHQHISNIIYYKQFF